MSRERVCQAEVPEHCVERGRTEGKTWSQLGPHFSVVMGGICTSANIVVTFLLIRTFFTLIFSASLFTLFTFPHLFTYYIQMRPYATNGGFIFKLQRSTIPYG